MHSQLEGYLSEVSARLAPLPGARRDDEIRELRQHLRDAVAAHQQAGVPEGEALAQALAQFGTPAEAAAVVFGAWQCEMRKRYVSRTMTSVPFGMGAYLLTTAMWHTKLGIPFGVPDLFCAACSLSPFLLTCLPPRYLQWLPAAWQRRLYVTPACAD